MRHLRLGEVKPGRQRYVVQLGIAPGLSGAEAAVISEALRSFRSAPCRRPARPLSIPLRLGSEGERALAARPRWDEEGSIEERSVRSHLQPRRGTGSRNRRKVGGGKGKSPDMGAVPQPLRYCRLYPLLAVQRGAGGSAPPFPSL